MCEWGMTRDVWVHVPPDLSHTGRWLARPYPIDECLASMVEDLQAAGLSMRGSCCGHGRGLSEITLWDGRRLYVDEREKPGTLLPECHVTPELRAGAEAEGFAPADLKGLGRICIGGKRPKPNDWPFLLRSIRYTCERRAGGRARAGRE